MRPMPVPPGPTSAQAYAQVAQRPVAFWTARISPTMVVIPPATARPAPSRPVVPKPQAKSRTPGTITKSGQPSRARSIPRTRSTRNRPPRAISTMPRTTPARPSGARLLIDPALAPRRSSSVAGRLGQLVLDRPESRLGPRGEPELAEDVRHVGPGRPFRDEQGGTDLLVAHPPAEQPDDVLLAIGQGFDRLALAALLRAHPLGEQAGDRWIEVDLARVCGANRGRDLFGFGVLEDVARCAGLEGGRD